MNMTTKLMMSFTVLLLVLALFLSLKNHSERSRLAGENEKLRGEFAAMQQGGGSMEENKRLRAALASSYDEIERKDANISLLQNAVAKRDTELVTKDEETEILKSAVDMVEGELTDEQMKIRDLQEIGEVIEADSDWNVVRINAGSVQNVNAGKTFALRRGYYIIGDLKIETVEENSSIGSMVTKTLRPGMTARVGDTVIPYPLY